MNFSNLSASLTVLGQKLGALVGRWSATVTAQTSAAVWSVINKNITHPQMSDIEALNPGDVLLSRSGTKSEVLERLGPAKFRFRKDKSYVGGTLTHYNFRLTEQGENLTSSDLFKLPVGTTVYGPEFGNPPMILTGIQRISDENSDPCGIEVSFEVTEDVNPERVVSIRKK